MAFTLAWLRILSFNDCRRAWVLISGLLVRQLLSSFPDLDLADYGGLDKGVSRELARIALPVSVYTEWYWKIDLHNLFHFLSLRMDPHAQQEIQDYAKACFALIQPIVPIAAEAFWDYHFDSMHLTRLEIEAIRSGQALATENKRETAEWDEKKRKLGM